MGEAARAVTRERILDDFARAYSMGVVALRYFNACGADPEGEIGELRDPETHLNSESDDGHPRPHH